MAIEFSGCAANPLAPGHIPTAITCSGRAAAFDGHDVALSGLGGRLKMILNIFCDVRLSGAMRGRLR